MTDIAPDADLADDAEDAAVAGMQEFEDDLGDPIEAADAGQPTVSVIVPTRNEALNLPYVAERMPAVDEIIVVDGDSIDGTVEVARRLWPDAVILQQTRTGKGNALACGFEAATGDIIVMIDADGSTDPAEIPAFVATLVAGADLAKGSRFSHGGGSDDITTLRRLGNKGLNWLVNRIFHTDFADLCYGYNAFWRRHLPVLDLPSTDLAEHQWGDGFEIETVINVRIARSSLRIREVGSFEGCRIHGRSNLNAVSDGLRVLRTIGRERREHLATTRARFSRETERLAADTPENAATTP